MTGNRIILSALMVFVLCWTVCNDSRAQHIGAGFDVYSFFDNSEGNDSYRDTRTHTALRFTPRLGFATNDSTHQLVGGYNFLYEYGTKHIDLNGLVMYYKYQNKKLRVLFGSFPRTMMHEEMPEYLICDSIRYYRPQMTGFSFLYTHKNGHFEAFCDWIQKRTENEREQFMAGLSTRFRFNKFQLGAEGYLYHYALEDGLLGEQHHIHETLTAHPYVGLLLSDEKAKFWTDIRAGVLFQADRDRSDFQWHTPFGFILDANAHLKRFSLQETFYAGKRQQVFGNQGFGHYYWGDTFLQSPWYSRTDIGYLIVSGKNIKLDAKLVFNFTDKGMQWHQVLTLLYKFDMKFM